MVAWWVTGTNDFTIGSGASLGVAARLVGTGSLRKGGEGSLRLRPATGNNFSGVTEVVLGDLELVAGGVAVPGPLLIGQTNSPSPASVRLLASEQIANAAPVTIHTNGIFILNIFSETIGDLTLIGGKVDTGSGELSPASITGIQAGAGFVPGNAGDIFGVVQLRSPATNLLTVFGDAGSRMEVRAQLRDSSDNGLAALEKRGPGHAYLSASNSFNGLTVLREGLLTVVHPFALGSTNFGTVAGSNTQFRLHDVTVLGEALTLDATADLHSVRESSWAGPITLGGDTDICVEDNAQAGKTLTLFGKISGPGGLKKIGAGVLVLSGIVANTYAGAALVEQGELHLGNGPGFNVPAIPGRLRVGGSAPPTTKTVKLLAPGQLSTNCVAEVIPHGILDVQGFSAAVAGLTVNNGVRVNGTEAGLLILNGPLFGKFALFFFPVGGYNPPVGQSFTLLRNDSALPISGTLKDRPEGVLVTTTSNQYFRVTYQGGDGNDLVVTKVPPPIAATLQSPVRLADGQMQLAATGTPGAWYEIHASENLSNPAGWHTLGDTVAPPDGTLPFKDTTAGNHPMRFYRFLPNY